MRFRSHIFNSSIRRTGVCLVAVWLFAAVTNIDRLHNHHTLGHGSLCDTDLRCESHSSKDPGRLVLIEDALGFHDAATCAACQLWSVLSSSDFVHPSPTLVDNPETPLCERGQAQRLLTTLLASCGRSPPLS